MKGETVNHIGVALCHMAIISDTGWQNDLASVIYCVCTLSHPSYYYLGQEKKILSFSGFFSQKMMRAGGFFIFLGRGPPLTTPIYGVPRAEVWLKVTGICKS